MNKNTISTLTDAISAVVDGNNDRATKLLLSAVKELSGDTSTLNYKSNKRGAKPLLNTSQVEALIERVKAGETIVSVAKSFGVSYQTAHRYISKSKTAVATPELVSETSPSL